MIDWDRVDDLRRDIGDAMFDDLVRSFLDEMAEAVAQLPLAPDARAGAAALHALAGGALNLGFTDLAALCQEGEQHLAVDAHAAVDPGQVAACFHAARDAFLAGLAVRSGTLPAPRPR